MDYFDTFVSILGSAIRLSIPLLFTALAGLFSERAGIFDIGLEGKMLASAFAAACVAYWTGNAWAGLSAGIVISIVFSLVHGFASITDMTITYLVDGYYNPADELGVAWDDPEVAADWGVDSPVLSNRDQANPRRADIAPEWRPHAALRT